MLKPAKGGWGGEKWKKKRMDAGNDAGFFNCSLSTGGKALPDITAATAETMAAGYAYGCEGSR